MLPLSTLLFACGNVDPAPADVDGLSRWFWTEYDDATPSDVLDATTNLWLAVDGDTLTDEPIDGLITDLQAEDVEHVELADGTDPTLGAGMFFARSIACPLEGIEQIVTALNQEELYVGVYDSYARSYTTDDAAYFDGTVDRIGWSVEIDSELLGTPYHETLRGGARYAPADDVERPHGDVLVSRTWMPSAATFEEGSNKRFDQDYQIEVYAARGDEVVHLYALWRVLDMGSGLDQDDEGVMRIVLNNLADWDDGTEEICASL